jgi:hypothetical protein
VLHVALAELARGGAQQVLAGEAGSAWTSAITSCNWSRNP